MNSFSVLSVQVVISTTILLRNLNILSLNAFMLGSLVPIEITHLTRGFKSLVSEHYMFNASPFTSSTGLFALSLPSANERLPMATGSKNVVAADVARAAWHIVTGIFDSSSRL